MLLFCKQRTVFQAGTLQYLHNATCSSAICQAEGHGAKLSVQPACCQDGGQWGASSLWNRGDSQPGVAYHETSPMTFPRDSCCPPDSLLGNTMSQEYGSPPASLASSRDLEGLQPTFRAACQNTCWEAVGGNARGLLYWSVFSAEKLGKWHTSLGEIQWPWYPPNTGEKSAWKCLTCFKLQRDTCV